MARIMSHFVGKDLFSSAVYLAIRTLPLAIIKIIQRFQRLGCNTTSLSIFLSRCDATTHWTCIDLRDVPGFGNPGSDRFCLCPAKFRQR